MDNTFFYILAYFVIYSFLGWILESVVRTICEKKLINTGFLFGPFCPIYGCGAIIMILFLDRFENNLLLLFIISFFVLSAWEYIVGVFLEKCFKTKYWDYSNHKFNYKGRVCLTNSLAWGVLGVLFIKFIHPFIEGLLNNVELIYIQIVSILIALVMLIDAIVSIVKVKNIKVTLQKIETINEQIKEKIAELAEKEKIATNANMQNVINKLKVKRDKTLRNLYRRAYRLKKAFPAIDTKEFTEILNKKIDLKYKKHKKEKKGD